MLFFILNYTKQIGFLIEAYFLNNLGWRGETLFELFNMEAPSYEWLRIQCISSREGVVS
jgi:hypothetical protein